MTRRIPWRLSAGAAVLLAFGLACGLGSSAPATEGGGPSVPTFAALDTPVESPELVPVPTAKATLSPAILQPYLLSLEWPGTIRMGDSDVIRLTLEVDENGRITPTAEFAGHVTTGQAVVIPDVYATDNVIAEARLELAGVQIDPAGLTSQQLARGQSVTFFWSIHPGSEGHYRGVAWFYLRYVPLDGGSESEQPLAALPVEFEATSLFGLKAGPARILGAVGALAGSILGVPFLEDVLRWLWKRFRRA
jgi:hypothetical protein